jgi:hypothetical protein
MIEQQLEISSEDAWATALVDVGRLSQKDARRIFNQTPDISTAFALPRRSLVCVDEGIIGGIHLPGSGVLMSTDERREAIRSAGIEEFTTHDNCGAFALAFPGESNPSRACREWGQREAALLELPFRHISAPEMDRPEHLHTATTIYYDGTGMFNRIAGLPKGFVVSRKYFNTATQDLDLCLKIAFGTQGFGDRFTAHDPLYVIPLAHPIDNSLSLKVLEREVHDVISPFGRRVKISGVKTAWHMRDSIVFRSIK